jgi:hypothetical protein
MNYNELELDHYNFFCPVTGVQILGESHCDESAPSLKAYWVDEVMDEPVIKDPGLEAAWAQLLEKFEEDEDGDFLMGDDLKKFLTNYVAPNWSVFEITTSGMSCGPTSSTVWLVIDLNTELEEEESSED